MPLENKNSASIAYLICKEEIKSCSLNLIVHVLHKNILKNIEKETTWKVWCFLKWQPVNNHHPEPHIPAWSQQKFLN